MVVLRRRPAVLCVRLDGPVEARIAQVVAGGVDEASARQGQREVDSAREAYARVFFNVRQDDPRLYHVILDSTVLSAEACTDIIVRAAQDRFGLSRPRDPGEPPCAVGLPSVKCNHLKSIVAVRSPWGSNPTPPFFSKTSPDLKVRSVSTGSRRTDAAYPTW